MQSRVPVRRARTSSIGSFALNGASAFLVCASASAQVTNAPVAPDTIYVGRVGSPSGISVIDLNGFGASTGDPTYDPLGPVEGNTNFPNNPNVKLQGSLLTPQLAPGTTTLDGGSAGVFTLTKDSTLDDLLLRAPSVRTVGDMMLGRPLDLLYNAGPAPLGCTAGGGDLCLASAFMSVEVAYFGGNVVVPAFVGGTPVNLVVGGGNPISFSPHPNPPPLANPPTCLQPLIAGQEPTSLRTLQNGLSNLLVPGDAFGAPLLGVPPTGLLTPEQNTFFVGPTPQSAAAQCQTYMLRQQIGHFLYVIDPAREQIVVLNSNTMTVLARIAVASPTELAMDPNVKLLAVSQSALDQVAFIDIDPSSTAFHQVVHVTPVGDGPSGIAWDPGNEDVLVCNENDDSVSIIATQTLDVRKVVSGELDRPFAVAITQRQAGFGFNRNVYYGYILDRSGHVSLYESGPFGVNGWGFDDIVGRFDSVFENPRAIQPDPSDLRSAVWIAHKGQLDHDGHPTGAHGGAVSKLVFASGVVGALPLSALDLASPPYMRDMHFDVQVSIGGGELSGIPLDIAFDNLRNLGALPNHTSVFSSAPNAPINGKSQVRALAATKLVNTNEPRYMFLPIRGGFVDVIRIDQGFTRVDTNPFHDGIQSIPAAGAAIVMDYFRQ